MSAAEVVTPPALDVTRCNEMQPILRSCEDPCASEKGKKLQVQRVYAVHEPDERGLVEVNYRDPVGPMTAYMNGRELAYVVEGW